MSSTESILLSIKPEYVRKIESGEKTYEFRRQIFKKIKIPTNTIYLKGTPRHYKNPKAKPVLIYIYETAPTKAITGYFFCDEIISNSPEKLWELFSDNAGMCKNEFFKYFSWARYHEINVKAGHALKITGFQNINPSIKLNDIDALPPPQNFKYLLENQMEKIIKIRVGLKDHLQLKEKVLQLFKEKKVTYASEAANLLNEDLRKTVDVVNDLINEGYLE